MKKRQKWMVLVVALAVAGCATIMQGTSQDIGFSSSPSQAKVFDNGNNLGVTPLTTKLARKDNHIIKFELDGYKPYEITITRSVSGWVWGNIVFGGLIGLVIDSISGGLYKLTPSQIHAELDKQGLSGLYNEDQMYFAVVLEPDPSWQKVGSLTRE